MIYYSSSDIIIRPLKPENIPFFVEEENKQGWDSTPDKLKMRLRHITELNATPLAAEYKGISQATSPSTRIQNVAPSANRDSRKSWTSPSSKKTGAGESEAGSWT